MKQDAVSISSKSGKERANNTTWIWQILQKLYPDLKPQHPTHSKYIQVAQIQRSSLSASLNKSFVFW